MEETIISIMTNKEFADRILDVKNYRKHSVRGVIFDDNNNVAVIYSPKENYYKLPGGGVEEGETDEVALQRECKEEAGIEATIGIALGTIVEQGKTGEIIQENRGYIVNIVGKKGKNKLTDEELERKFELYRMDIDEAIVLIKKTSPSSYRGRFMQERDLTFLQEARKLIS